MVSKKNRTIRRALNVLGIFWRYPVRADFRSMVVCRMPDAPEVQDPWQRRVINLCDRRAVSAVIKELYTEEVSQGGWVSDIGLWHNLFDHQVARTIRELADQGYLYLEPQYTGVDRGDGG